MRDWSSSPMEMNYHLPCQRQPIENAPNPQNFIYPNGKFYLLDRIKLIVDAIPSICFI